MQDDLAAAFARVVETLTALRQVLSKIVPVDDRETKVRPILLAAYNAWHDLPAELTLDVHSPPAQLGNFLNAKLLGYYTVAGLLDPAAIPAPPAILREIGVLIEDFGGAKRRQRAITITQEDELILATLADAYPAAVNQPDLAALTTLPRQKISERLAWLEAKPRRYVERPEGTRRKGHAITAAGLSAIGRPVEGSH